MMPWLRLMLCVVLCASPAIVLAQGDDASETTEPRAIDPPQTTPRRTAAAAFAEDYGVIVERNIFLRDRRPPPTATRNSSTTRSETPPPPPLSPQEQHVLVGVVLDEHLEARAFIEHVPSGRLSQLPVRSAIAEGQITAITLDSIAFELDGRTITIGMGQNLAGQAGGQRLTARPGTDTTGTSSAGEPAAGTDPGSLSVEERMRLRRQQELGQ